MFYSALTHRPVYSTQEVSIDRSKTICVTGHREKSIIPYKGDPQYLEITKAAARLLLDKYIDILMDSGYTTLLSGLAEGADLWAADHVLCRKKLYKPINNKLIGVMPYMKHSNGFSSSSLEKLERVEKYSELLITTNDNVSITYGRYRTPTTDPNLYKVRNYYLVDNSSAVVSFFNESNHRSGTAQTLKYAEKCHLPIYRFSIEDVYRLIDKAGPDKMAISDELKKLQFKVNGPVV